MSKTTLQQLMELRDLLTQKIQRDLLKQFGDKKKILVTNKKTGNVYQVTSDYYNKHRSLYDLYKPGIKTPKPNMQTSLKPSVNKPAAKKPTRKPTTQQLVADIHKKYGSYPGEKSAHPAFKSMKDIMDDDMHEGAYNWKKDGKKLNTALAHMSEQGELSNDDLIDLYLHHVAGDKLNNKSLAKRKAYPEYMHAMDDLEDSMIQYDDYQRQD